MAPQIEQLTADMNVVLNRANSEAERRHGNYLDVEYLLLGLLRHPGGTAYDLFRLHNVNTGALYDQVASSVGMERPIPAPIKGLSRGAKMALDRAGQEASALQHSALDTGHLLISLMSEADGAVHDTLAALPFTMDDARAYLRAQRPPQPSRVAGGSANRAGSPAPLSGDRQEFVLVPARPAKKQPARPGTAQRSNNNWVWILAGLGVLVAYMAFVLPAHSFFAFGFVLVGWIFSLTLHEFSHALVAYLGGDYTVKEKGYLSFNPLKYMHPMLSIVLPLIFLAMGGIGLPGGAVYIERHRLKNKWWGAAVSAAGPAANLLLAIILASPFALGLVDTNVIELKLRYGASVSQGTIWQNTTLWSAVAFLAMLQVTAVCFNLLPIPPLDGFGIIEPFLDERTRFQLMQLGMFGMLIIFVIMWTPLGNTFWKMIFDACQGIHIPVWLINEGFNNFMFWRKPPQ